MNKEERHQRVSVSLPPAVVERLAVLGGGSVSRGIVRVVEGEGNQYAGPRRPTSAPPRAVAPAGDTRTAAEMAAAVDRRIEASRAVIGPLLAAGAPAAEPGAHAEAVLGWVRAHDGEFYRARMLADNNEIAGALGLDPVTVDREVRRLVRAGALRWGGDNEGWLFVVDSEDS